jgi:murein tripeptide amidase MpaA
VRPQTLLAVLALAVPAAAQTNERVRIADEAPEQLAHELHARGFDVLPEREADALQLIVSPGEKRALLEEGYTLDVLDVGRPFRDIQAERMEAAALDGTVPSGYPDLGQIYASMSATAAAYPSIAKLVNLTATYGTPATVEGRSLFALKISDNVGVDEDEPSFLMAFAHHCREIVTPVIALHHIDQLTTLYGSNPGVTQAVDGYEIWIAPVWNPDGYEYVFCCDNNWRKNRRDLGGGEFGVDLNRNYPFGWGAASSCSGSTTPSSSTYGGPSAASEAETQTMVALGNDRRFTKVHDYHSYSEEVRHGYGCWSHPFDNWLQSEAAALSQAGGYNGNTASSCCTAGDFHWHGATYGAHSFLWETHTIFQPSYSSAQAEAVKVWPGAVEMLVRPISLSGHVTDACTGAPLEADLDFVGVSFQNGESYGSGGPFGRYHAFLPPGPYTARFSRAGYLTQDHPILVTASSAVQIEVALEPITASIVSYCTAGTSASGCQASVSSSGSPSASAPSGFVVSAATVEGDVNGQFYYGTNGRSAGSWGNGTSFRCVLPPTWRAGVQSGSGAPGTCDGSFAQDLTVRWQAKPNTNPGAGSVVQLQFWFRDPQNTSNQTTSFSDALEFGVCP